MVGSARSVRVKVEERRGLYVAGAGLGEWWGRLTQSEVRVERTGMDEVESTGWACPAVVEPT